MSFEQNYFLLVLFFECFGIALEFFKWIVYSSCLSSPVFNNFL